MNANTQPEIAMPLMASRTRALTIAMIAVIAFAFVVSTMEAMTRQSADLFAMWLAGEFTAMGQLDQVYPANPAFFDMTSPDKWWPHVAATDPKARIFPYIYPPIWAKLMSWVTQVTTFQVFDAVVLIIHQTLLIATTYLAAKMCGLRGQSALMMLSITYAAMVLTMPIATALGENQPQILVSFLIVFAFERAASGNPRAAGILLALAASIKVYPLLFIVIFAARRDWPAVKAFIIAGGALALTSVVLVGWPLHANYLHLLGTVSKSVIVTSISFSIDAFLACTVFKDHLILIMQPNNTTGWNVITKGPVWSAVSSVIQIGAIVAVGVMAARRPKDPFVLPFAAALFAILSPLSWGYTYLPAFVFVGYLPVRMGRVGLGFAVILAAYFHPAIAAITLDAKTFGLSTFWVYSVVLMALLVGMLAAAIMVRRDD